MLKHKKLLAAFACVAMVFVIFFSIFFLALEYNHHCVGEDCQICHEIKGCTQVLRSLGLTAAVLLSIASVIGFWGICAAHKALLSASYTLVSLKVKLSN